MNQNNIVLLIVASPTTHGAGAYQFWEHLRPSLEEQGAKVILLRGHSDTDTHENQPLSISLKSIRKYRSDIGKLIENESVTHVITSISQSDILHRAFLLKISRLFIKTKIRPNWFVFALGQPYPVKGQTNLIKTWIWKNLWLKSVRDADSIFTVSDYLNRLIAAQLPSQSVITVYPGLQLSEKNVDTIARDKPVRTQKSMGFVGRLSIEKDPELYCQIASILPEYTSNMYGDGELRTVLEEKYDNVIFHGFTDRESIYENIDLMLITSHSEGLPTIIMEAGTLGVIPIVADVGGCSEAIHPENRSLLVIPKRDRINHDEWRRAILRLETPGISELVIERQRDWINTTFKISKTAQSVLHNISGKTLNK